MMSNSTIETLKIMRFSAMAAELQRQLHTAVASGSWGGAERQ